MRTVRAFLYRWRHIIAPIIFIGWAISFAATGIHLWGIAGAVLAILLAYGAVRFGSADRRSSRERR